MLMAHALKDICRGHRHCVLCRNKEAGKRFREHVLAVIANPPQREDFDCPEKKEWSNVWPEPTVIVRDTLANGKQNVIPKTVQSELSKQRFEICKQCEHATENGHKCALHKGCCFGGWRAKPESKCYAGKW
jgi:hypothetical protein